MGSELLQSIVHWWDGVDGAFRFLLVLPFVVALAGWLADRWRPQAGD